MTKRLKLSRPSGTSRLSGPTLKQPGTLLKDHQAGLQNLGNTCYLNAVLQILLRTPEFNEELQREQSEQGEASSGASELLVELALLFGEMARSA